MKEKYRERIKNKANSNDDGLMKDEHKKLIEKVREIIKIFGLETGGGSSIEETYHSTKKLYKVLDYSTRR